MNDLAKPPVKEYPYMMTDRAKFTDTRINPALPLSILRNIANFMGLINKQTAIEFLEECGIPSKKINRKKETSEMIYEALKTLAIFTKSQDRKLLETVIKESVRPSLYQNENLTLEEIITKYNEFLTGIELEVINFKGAIHLIDRYVFDSDWYEAQKNLEEDFAKKVKENTSVLERIVEIRNAYKILLQIINSLSLKEKIENKDMNSIYIKLFNIVEDDINYVHSNLTNVYPDWNQGGSRSTEFVYDAYMTSRMAGNFFQPYIYRDWNEKEILYRPFLNLYSTQAEMEKTGENWDVIKNRMNECYAMLEDRFHRFGADKIINYPCKEYLDKIEKELKTQNVTTNDSRGNLTFHLKTGKIIFTAPSGHTYEAELRRGSNGYVLLQYLISQDAVSNGRIFLYTELAEYLNKNAERLNKNNAHANRDEVRSVKDAIGTIRRSLKLRNNDDLFITSYGFGLNCNSSIRKD